MKCRIYLRRFGRLIKLYKLHRSRDGLYIFSFGSKDYVTYHEDGKYWARAGGKRFIKKIKQPLSSFTGIQSLVSSYIAIIGPTTKDLDETKGLVNAEDIVLELEGNFWIEMVLSDSTFQLSESPERLNSTVYVKEHWKPVLTIEAFQLAGNVFPNERYPSREEWVEGENFFIDHRGRI